MDAHHGGAWKVAYADFVTAMMALFIVLWLLNTSQDTQKMIGGYFMDPLGKGRETREPECAARVKPSTLRKDDMTKLKEKIAAAMKEAAAISGHEEPGPADRDRRGTAHRVAGERGWEYSSNRDAPSQRKSAARLLDMLAHQLGMLPNKMLIEGHTDSKPYNNDRNYTNWELSADRANAARRLMENGGLKEGQVAQVRGFADQNLFDSE